MSDPVNHPDHYLSHPSGIECITITEHMGFCLGNAFKYIWRAGEKGNTEQDLRKAIWYIEREISKLTKVPPGITPAKVLVQADIKGPSYGLNNTKESHVDVS